MPIFEIAENVSWNLNYESC